MPKAARPNRSVPRRFGQAHPVRSRPDALGRWLILRSLETDDHVILRGRIFLQDPFNLLPNGGSRGTPKSRTGRCFGSGSVLVSVSIYLVPLVSCSEERWPTSLHRWVGAQAGAEHRSAKKLLATASQPLHLIWSSVTRQIWDSYPLHRALRERSGLKIEKGAG